MTQYLGPQSLLNSSIVRRTPHLTQCTLQNLIMRTVQGMQLWLSEVFSRRRGARVGLRLPIDK